MKKYKQIESHIIRNNHNETTCLLKIYGISYNLDLKYREKFRDYEKTKNLIKVEIIEKSVDLNKITI